MRRDSYEVLLNGNIPAITRVRQLAWELHDSVNQRYDGDLPYGAHLDMVADGVITYGHEVIDREADLLPVIFGAYFHDSIEDARQTYNDVLATASRLMDGDQALMAAEIVFALTNDKGRTRAERAGERYYAGIRLTPYAPMVKLCDRIANTRYSAEKTNGSNSRMAQVYRDEFPHFIASITAAGATDPRLALPPTAVADLKRLSQA